jgi:polyhydroxybutyrate depolymerase
MKFLFKKSFLIIFALLLISSPALAGRKLFSSTTASDKIKIEDSDRNFLYYAPSSKPLFKAPLILVLHGANEGPRDIEAATQYRFNELADNDGAVICYPEGVDFWWNFDSKATLKANRQIVDDVKFISVLIDHLVSKYSLDPHRVYVTGMSAGAIMALRLASELPHKITAVAPVAGSNPLNFLMNCDSKPPVSILFMNGDQDNLVPFNGGMAHMGNSTWEAQTDPVPLSVDHWATCEECFGRPVTTDLPVINRMDPTRVQLVTYPVSNKGADILFYVIHGGGHRWPNAFQYPGVDQKLGKMSVQIDATTIIWDFFKRHIR